MRRLSRIESTSLPLKYQYRLTPRSQFVCAACRATAAHSSRSAAIHTSAIRAAQGGVPLLERVRRKIMGSGEDKTAAPAATAISTQETPATNETILDPAVEEKTDRKSKRAEKRASRQSGPKIDPTYEPATTWDGLEEVGEIVDPREYTRVPGQIFTGFMASESMTDPEELIQALKDSFSLAATTLSGAETAESMNDPAWLRTPFESQTHKFTVVKKFMQCSGVRIPDQIIHSAKDAQALINHVIEPPKPKKLVETLLANDSLQELPNVKIYQRRVTPIDKEIQLGRWKVIEKELEARGLPVTGHT